MHTKSWGRSTNVWHLYEFASSRGIQRRSVWELAVSVSFKVTRLQQGGELQQVEVRGIEALRLVSEQLILVISIKIRVFVTKIY